MIIRRIAITVLACVMIVFLLPPAGGKVAIAQDETAGISASMNSFYYAPGDLAYLDVEVELTGNARTDDISLEFLLYPSAATRSSLASFREGTRRYVIYRRTLETISPDSEWTDKLYEIDLKRLGLQTGVYPFETRLVRGGEVLSADQNFLVIMDPANGYPLNLSLLWTLDFLPPTDAQGNDLDTGLASACSSSTSQPGFLYSLARVMKKNMEVGTSLVIPRDTYDDLEQLAGAAEDEDGGEEEAGAAEVLATIDTMSDKGEADLIATTFSFADPDVLAARGWEEDASEQMELGLEGAGVAGFVAPLFRLSDAMLQRMVENDMEFTVVGQEALESSAAGRRLLEGTTISQPVRFVNSNGYLLKAFVRDETLYAYLESTPERDASHMVQNIFAELAVLQRERPYAVRSCVLAFPSGFLPSQSFLDELYGAVDACPWLQPRRLSELNNDQFPLEDVALQAPVYPDTPSSYMQRLEEVRGKVEDFTAMIPTDHSLRESLRLSLLVAENYRFTTDKDAAAAQAYLSSIDAVIAGETSQVSIELKRSVTLSSTEGKLSVDVTSSLAYPLEKVTLRLDNASLTFPQGNSMEVTIEPRENRFIFDVDTHRKGSFIVDIMLEADDLLIDSTSITVNTSIINTLAIILLACLAFIVALVIVMRRLLRRYRGGKHSRGRSDK
ncbi:MAG: hypothetical protein C4536_00435 [Actinobacteria bacterium]|jgi:hypothetical protein|nr:MAG: hypothetical protein C4536_00435 [Actinomycetota bacterium]